MTEPMAQQRTWDPAQENRGLECRCRGCKNLGVVTRPTSGNRIMRQRECRSCGRRISTWEKAGAQYWLATRAIL